MDVDQYSSKQGRYILRTKSGSLLYFEKVTRSDDLVILEHAQILGSAGKDLGYFKASLDVDDIEFMGVLNDA